MTKLNSAQPRKNLVKELEMLSLSFSFGGGVRDLPLSLFS